MKPIIIVNFKTYEQGTGEQAEKLAQSIGKISKENGVEIVSAVQIADVYRISKLGVPVFCQHVDHVVHGSSTGHVLPECVKQNGAVGTLINHSERRIGLDKIALAVDRCKKIGLKTVVCVENLEETKEVLKMSPDYIALEDPNLIGSGISITNARPDVLKEFVSLFENSDVIPLCGAGVSCGEDVGKALELGMKGVLLASAVVKSDKPEEVLMDLVKMST